MYSYDVNARKIEQALTLMPCVLNGVGARAVLRRYGLELGNYSDPVVMAAARATWHRLYSNMPRVDLLFIPGGDPGSHAPAEVLVAAAAQRAVLVAHHPNATVWLSMQNFYLPDMDVWFAALAAPGVKDWLAGVVYGPWTTIDLPEFKARTPPGLAVRLYPDLAHSLISQYPVGGWDPAHARTAYREPINPRPLAHAAVAALTLPGTVGFGAYSEGE